MTALPVSIREFDSTQTLDEIREHIADAISGDSSSAWTDADIDAAAQQIYEALQSEIEGAL